MSEGVLELTPQLSARAEPPFRAVVLAGGRVTGLAPYRSVGRESPSTGARGAVWA